VGRLRQVVQAHLNPSITEAGEWVVGSLMLRRADRSGSGACGRENAAELLGTQRVRR
jgi:hypothetical protein